MVSASVKWPILSTKISVDFQGAEENCVLRSKEWFAGTQKKWTFFNFLIIQIVLDYAVLERSCPRTYLPSRAGATHALRVLSSVYEIFVKNILVRTKNPTGARAISTGRARVHHTDGLYRYPYNTRDYGFDCQVSPTRSRPVGFFILTKIFFTNISETS